MTTELAREVLRHVAPQRASAVAVGVFDGVHRGHQHLLGHMLGLAARDSLATVAVTFYPHPRLVLQPQTTLSYICSLEERVERLRGLGMDAVAIFPFTFGFSQTSARDFVSLLAEELAMRRLVVGPDFALGRAREGTIPVLAELGRKMGFTVEVAPLLTEVGDKVGSTAIRSALAQGDMAGAALLLGRPFGLRGLVVKGAERGRGLGFPTANLAVGADQALPSFGIYVTKAYLGAVHEPPLPAVTNIGVRPTFGETKPTVETYIMDFQGDLYGQEMRIELLSRLRDEVRFPSVEELIAQIEKDVAQARAHFGLMEAVHPVRYSDSPTASESVRRTDALLGEPGPTFGLEGGA